ncbi:hypothetical protein ACLOJK_024340 [Asimina triloba]
MEALPQVDPISGSARVRRVPAASPPTTVACPFCPSLARLVARPCACSANASPLHARLYACSADLCRAPPLPARPARRVLPALMPGSAPRRCLNRHLPCVWRLNRHLPCIRRPSFALPLPASACPSCRRSPSLSSREAINGWMLARKKDVGVATVYVGMEIGDDGVARKNQAFMMYALGLAIGLASGDGFIVDDGDVVCDCLDGGGDVGWRWDSSDQRELVVVVDSWGSDHWIGPWPEVRRTASMAAVPNGDGGAPLGAPRVHVACVLLQWFFSILIIGLNV